MFKKIPVSYILRNKVYRVDNVDLNIKDKNGKIIPGSHDVIVTSYNKRSGKCKVKTITSLEKRNKSGQYKFKDNKLSSVKYGKILLVPIHEINTHHLSGINQTEIEVKIDKIYFTTTKAIYPRRYKNLLK